MHGFLHYHLATKKRPNEVCRFKLPANEQTESENIPFVGLWKKASSLRIYAYTGYKTTLHL